MTNRKDCPKHAPQVIAQKASNDVLLFNMEDGNYYSLNEIGGRIWELCDGSRSVSQVVESLAAEYGASEEVLEQDVAELLAELENGKLIV
jgi:coenzyme PQQ biosynthesis protein PqqD